MEMVLVASVFQTVEFYVIVSVVAAAVIAVVSLPERKGEVKLHLIAGELLQQADFEAADGPGNGQLLIEVHAGNFVSIRRTGLDGVTMAGAVSLAVKVSGFDIVIEERVTAGAASPFGMATGALFHLDFLAPEWYHIRYESERFSEHAAFTLHVREGIVMRKPLIH
ncbi:MAG: hypothetical protein K2J12_11345 [Muribaculaceae bacterium]|nr:hypothetical protein [Muribaculaceae bacterium]